MPEGQATKCWYSRAACMPAAFAVAGHHPGGNYLGVYSIIGIIIITNCLQWYDASVA